MIVLVDFENTHQNGLDGYHYLNENDTLVVYYSDENSAIPKGMVLDLKEKQVNVKMVKLLKQHSNALDMYIASTTGMYLESGEKICIVSKDKGYAAVRDFWHSLRGAEILLGETIEECFLHSVQNDDERIRKAKERYQRVQLTQAFETMNKVPTRPTLSRGNHRKKQYFDTNKNLEPIALLPDPLAKKPNEEEETVQADLAENENEREAHLDTNENLESDTKLSEEKKGKEQISVSEERLAEVRPLLPRGEEKKRTQAISYVYDPISRTMKMVGGEEEQDKDSNLEQKTEIEVGAVSQEKLDITEDQKSLGSTEEKKNVSTEKVESSSATSSAGSDMALESIRTETEEKNLSEKQEDTNNANNKNRHSKKKVSSSQTDTKGANKLENRSEKQDNSLPNASESRDDLPEKVASSEERIEEKDKKAKPKRTVARKKKAKVTDSKDVAAKEKKIEEAKKTSDVEEQNLEGKEEHRSDINAETVETKPKRRGRKPKKKLEEQTNLSNEETSIS